MKSRITAGLAACAVVAGMAAGAAFIAGCETAESDANAFVLEVSPQLVELSGGAATSVIFTATAKSFSGGGSSTSAVGSIFLPLRWAVSDRSLGSIAGAAGNQALYSNVPGTEGQNIITVSDQAGSEGMAVVNQSL
jgi:hypothetical protein